MTKSVITIGFLVAFAAGLVVGMNPRQGVAPEPAKPSRRGGWLAAELNLSPQQQQQLDAIWSETAWRGGREREDRRRQLIRERDEAIVALIRPEDKPKYDEILKNYTDQTAALEREWRGSFQTAVERTKEVLTPEQRVKYEEMLKRHESERGPRDWRRGDRDRDGGRDRDRDGGRNQDWNRESGRRTGPPEASCQHSEA